MSGILAMVGGSLPSPVTIDDGFVEHIVADPSDATASYTLANDRSIADHTGSIGTWLASIYAVADFEVRATLQSGTTPSSGNIGTWNNLATTRSWTQSRTAIGLRTCELLIEIGYAGVNSALDSAVITITAEVD